MKSFIIIFKNNYKKIEFWFFILSIIGLTASFTNRIPIAGLPSVIFLFGCSFYFKLNNIPKITAYLWLFYSITLVSIILYFPNSFIESSFYKKDGNLLISYAPLLILPFLTLNFHLEKYFYYFIIIVLILNLIIYQIGVFSNGNIFHGFFKAHNANGGYFSILTSFLITYLLKEKNKLFVILLLLICSFIFIKTHSRGSIIGLVFGVLCYYFFLIKKNYLSIFVLISIILFQIALITNSWYDYERSKAIGLKKHIIEKHGMISGSKANIYIRLYFDWPKSIECFMESPLVGTGFGSVNDSPYNFSKTIPHIFSYNSSKIKFFDSSHAHHSFFHILGEQGIIGLIIFLQFWFSLFLYLKKQENTISRDFLILAFWTITFSALTEHRITTPATMIPFCLYFGLYYAIQNYKTKEQIDEKIKMNISNNV